MMANPAAGSGAGTKPSGNPAGGAAPSRWSAMADQDVFVNVVGGVKVTETSADLALLLAMVSSLRDRPPPQDLVVFGEVGLAGDPPWCPAAERI